MPGDPVVGGTVLRRPAIASPNYAAGVAGWTVNADGSAELGDATIRGAISASQIIGSTIQSSLALPFTQIDPFGNIKMFSASGSVIIQQSPAYEAIFIYEELFGPQGPLLVALAGKAGTDPNTGTAFPAGLYVAAGVIEGAQIIAFGASGEILVYSGTPAAGNLTASISHAAGTDQFGNAYLAGCSSYSGAGGFWLASSMSAGLISTYSAAGAAGPWTQLTKVGAIQNDGDSHFAAVGGSHMVADTLWFALDPVAGSGRALWQDMRPLSNSFAGTIAGTWPPQYRLTPAGFVEVIGHVQFPAAGGPNFNSVTFATLPAQYRPGLAHRWPVAFTTNVTPVGTPFVAIDSAGNLQFHSCPTSGMLGNIASIYGRYPLNNPVGP